MHVFFENHRVVISLNHRQAEDLVGILREYAQDSCNPFRVDLAIVLGQYLTALDGEVSR